MSDLAKELKAKNCTLTCQDGTCLSCEATLSAEILYEEYSEAKASVVASFG